jgi:hypothetical protein
MKGIMYRLNWDSESDVSAEGILPCERFDLMGGSGTGGQVPVIPAGPLVISNDPKVDRNSVHETTDVAGGSIRGVLHDYRASVQPGRSGSFGKNNASAKMYGRYYEEKGVATRPPAYPENTAGGLLRVSQALSPELLLYLTGA